MKLLTKLQLFCTLAVYLLIGTVTTVNAQICPEVEDISATAVSTMGVTFEWDTDPLVNNYSVDILKNGIMEVVNQTIPYSPISASYDYVPSIPMLPGDEIIVEVRSNCSSGPTSSWTETFELYGVIATVEDIYVGSMPEEYTGSCPDFQYYIGSGNEREGWLKWDVQYCWNEPEIYECIVAPEPGEHRTYMFKDDLRICNEAESISETSDTRGKVGADITNAQLSPNPLVENGMVEFDLNRDTNVAIDITDISGSSLYHKITEEALSAGRHQVEVNRNDLQPGIYILRIRTNQSIKMVKFSIAY